MNADETTPKDSEKELVMTGPYGSAIPIPQVNEIAPSVIPASNKPGDNPLNSLGFDINSLMPYNDFNWECVEGMDQIHESTQGAYNEVQKQLLTRIANLQERLVGIDETILGVLERVSTNIGQGITQADEEIASQLAERVKVLQDEHGNGISKPACYIVYHETSEGAWKPIVEWLTSPPIGVESYGPFPDCYPLTVGWSLIREQLPDRRERPSQSISTVNNLLQTIYQNSIATIQQTSRSDWQEGMGIDGQGTQQTQQFWNTGNISSLPVPTTTINNITINNPVSNGESIQQPTITVPNAENIPIAPMGNITANNPNVVRGMDQGTPTVLMNEALPAGSMVVNNSNTHSSVSNQTTNNLNQTLPADNQDTALVPIPQSPIVTMSQPLETSLAQLVLQISNCCQQLGNVGKALSNQVGKGDLEYLYSDEGQARIDSFLQRNGLSDYEFLYPDDFGQAIKNMIQNSKKGVGTNA